MKKTNEPFENTTHLILTMFKNARTRLHKRNVTLARALRLKNGVTDSHTVSTALTRDANVVS